MTSIGLCLQLHSNMIMQFKNQFASFKRCWDKQKPVYVSVSETYFTLYSLSQNELIPDIDMIFQVETNRIIENLILTPPHNESQITLQIVDFGSLVLMINNIDVNAEDVRFFLEQIEQSIFLGCEVIKQDETKIQRLFETKITINRDIDVQSTMEATPVDSSLLAQIFFFAYKFETSLEIQFFTTKHRQALKLSLITDQLPSVTQFIVPSGTNLQSLSGTADSMFVVNHIFCQKANEICSLEDIILIQIRSSKLILSYNKEGIIKQFMIPEIYVENDHKKIEFNQ